MIDFNAWHKDFKQSCGYQLPKEPDPDFVEVLGILDNGKEAVKFVSDMEFIYANGKPIIACYNDSLTAMPVFAETMKLICGEKFKEIYWSSRQEEKEENAQK
jgi:hypothetical protein